MVAAGARKSWICVDWIPALRPIGDTTANQGAVAALLKVLEGGFDVKIVVPPDFHAAKAKQLIRDWLDAHDLPPLDLATAREAEALQPRVSVRDVDFLLTLAGNLELADPS